MGWVAAMRLVSRLLYNKAIPSNLDQPPTRGANHRFTSLAFLAISRERTEEALAKKFRFGRSRGTVSQGSVKRRFLGGLLVRRF